MKKYPARSIDANGRRIALITHPITSNHKDRVEVLNACATPSGACLIYQGVIKK